MGQKIHPYGLRLGIVTDWKSRWYSEKDYASQVNEDAAIRRYLKAELKRGAVSRVDIERVGDKKVQVDVHTARPGVVIGRSGSEAERLRTGLEKLTGRLVKLNVIEVQNGELDATLLARSVADQLEGRVSFRRAMKRTVQTALKAGAEGVRVQAAGRLGGSDMGRREWYREGRVPLHTLRADVDFGRATAHTTVGTIGIKVWVYKGDLLPSLASSREKIAAEARLAAGGPAGRRAPAKARAEAAAGEGKPKRLIEAGGGKRLIEAGGGKRKEGGKRLIEAGGGKRPSAAEAKAEFEEAVDEVAPAETPAAAEATPVTAEGETPAVPEGAAAEAPPTEAAPAEAAVEPVEAAVEEPAAIPEPGEPAAADDAPVAESADEATATAEAAPDVSDETPAEPAAESAEADAERGDA